jgi:hypothetical protein
MMMMMMKSTCMAQVSIPWNAHCALKKGDKNSNDRTEIDKRRHLGAYDGSGRKQVLGENFALALGSSVLKPPAHLFLSLLCV